MKCCGELSGNCLGEVRRFSVNSSENHSYPNRYWGVSDYCEEHADEEQKFNYILKEVSHDTPLITL